MFRDKAQWCKALSLEDRLEDSSHFYLPWYIHSKIHIHAHLQMCIYSYIFMFSLSVALSFSLSLLNKAHSHATMKAEPTWSGISKICNQCWRGTNVLCTTHYTLLLGKPAYWLLLIMLIRAWHVSLTPKILTQNEQNCFIHSDSP